MRRITIAIDDDLLRELKRRAATDRVTFRSLVNDLLRRALHAPSRGAFKFHLTTVKGRLRRGVDIDDKDALFDVMDGIVRTARSSPGSPARATSVRRKSEPDS